MNFTLKGPRAPLISNDCSGKYLIHENWHPAAIQIFIGYINSISFVNFVSHDRRCFSFFFYDSLHFSIYDVRAGR